MVKKSSTNGRSLKVNSIDQSASYAAAGSVVGIAATSLLLSSTLGTMAVISAGAFVGAKLSVEHGPKLINRFKSVEVTDKK